MQDHEMRGLLGPAYDETTEEQRQVIDRACDTLGRRWPGVDYTDERTEALNAALEVVLGDGTAEQVAAEWRASEAAAKVAHRRLTGAIIAESLAGATETALSRRLGLTRVTVRKALGK